MRGRIIDDRISWVGAIDWDRRLFDELIPLPDGTSYNSYLVRGSEKTALIDTVDPLYTAVLLARLEAENIKKIDYLIANHAEQDHSGSLPALLARFPAAQVIATEKCQTMLVDLLNIPAEKVTPVKDGARISLGDLTLEFISFPWVHWPETMLTWLPERKVLFSCDLFGSHLASSDLLVRDAAEVLSAAKRYYAEIMMPFRGFIEKNLGKVQALDISMIAPGHGPVYPQPKLILEAYRDWISATPKNLVVVPYISMHDSTRRMVEHFVEACIERGLRVAQVNLADPDIGKLAMLLVDAATIVVGTPTVLVGAHPKVANVVSLANQLRPKVRFLSIIGSFGWGGKVVEQLGAMVNNLKVEVLSPVLCKGSPKAADLDALDRLADEVARKHAALAL